jgi:hypothetical protein
MVSTGLLSDATIATLLFQPPVWVCVTDIFTRSHYPKHLRSWILKYAALGSRTLTRVCKN